MVLPVLQSLLTLGLLLAAFGFMARRLWHFGVLINTGTRGDEPLTDSPGERTRTMLAYTLGQKRLKEDAAAGLLHGVFLYGFLILGLGHFEVILEGLTAFLRASGGRPFLYERRPPLVPQRPLPPQPGRAGRRGPGGRRDRPPPALHRQPGAPAAAIEGRREDPLVHRRAVRHLLPPGGRDRTAEAARRRVTRQPSRTSPSAPSRPRRSRACRPPAAQGLRALGWWTHVLVFLGFAAYLPTTKHMHLVFAWPNIWLFRRERYGLPPKIDFEKTEKFGIDRVQELPWKSLLDSYACTECGRCNAVCPAHATGKPLMPMKVLHDVKVNLRDRNGADILRFRDPKGRPLPGQGRGRGGVRAEGAPRLEARDRPGEAGCRASRRRLPAGGRAGPRRRAVGVHDLRRLRRRRAPSSSTPCPGPSSACGRAS